MSDCFLVTLVVIVLDTVERQAGGRPSSSFTYSASSEMHIMRYGKADSTCIHLLLKFGSENKDMFMRSHDGLQYYMRCGVLIT